MGQHANISHASIGAAVITQDDGSTVGTASVLNFTNGTTTYSGGTATINLNSGGGISGIVMQSGGNTVGTATVINHSNGTVTFSGGTATVVALPSSALGTATANTVLATDTLADVTGCSVSLAAGSWVIWGTCTFDTGGANYILAAITDSSNNKVSEGRGTRSTASPITLAVPSMKVSPGSTTTYKLRAQVGAAGTALQYAESTVPGTTITAIRVA